MPGIVEIPYKPHEFQKEIFANRKRRNVYVCHRRFGKTVHEVNTLIMSALSSNYKDWRGAYIAPLLNQAKDIAWDYLKYYTNVVPGVKYNETELRVDFPNGSRIKLYGADNPDKLRGLFFDGVVMDEVAQMPADLWESVVSHTLREMHNKERQEHKWCDFIGTPMGMNVFFDLYQNALNNPNWGVGFYPITTTNLLSAEEIEEAKLDCRTESKFNREYLCDFSASAEDILIPLSLAHPALGKHIVENDYRLAPKIIGIDVGGENDYHVISRRQGLAALPQIKFMEPDHMLAAARMAHVISEYEPDATFIDQGHGYGVISRLRQLGYSVTEIQFGQSADDPDHFLNKRAEMYSRCKDYLREGGSLPNDPILLADLTSPMIVPTTTGKLQLEAKHKIKERLGRSPDDGDAFVLTFAANVKTKKEEQGNILAFKRRKKKYDVLSRFRSNGINM